MVEKGGAGNLVVRFTAGTGAAGVGSTGMTGSGAPNLKEGQKEAAVSPNVGDGLQLVIGWLTD